jgi:hypothetical protein
LFFFVKKLRAGWAFGLVVNPILASPADGLTLLKETELVTETKSLA